MTKINRRKHTLTFKTKVAFTAIKGDALFFDPAVFHEAGDNVTEDISHIAKLMQISSGYVRSIEIVDRKRSHYWCVNDMVTPLESG